MRTAALGDVIFFHKQGTRHEMTITKLNRTTFTCIEDGWPRPWKIHALGRWYYANDGELNPRYGEHRAPKKRASLGKYLGTVGQLANDFGCYDTIAVGVQRFCRGETKEDAMLEELGLSSSINGAQELTQRLDTFFGTPVYRNYRPCSPPQPLAHRPSSRFAQISWTRAQDVPP